MNHILLIDYYLFTKYPEILRIRAMAFLASVPDDERMYVKIMRPRVDTSVLNRNNFVRLSTAAYAAAKYENPSMRNYRGGQESATGGHIDKIVTTFLTVRTTFAISSMIRSPFSYLSEVEMTIIEREATLTSQGIPTVIGIAADEEEKGELPPLQLSARQNAGTSTPTPPRA
jgi:hypothetical protein